MPSACGDGTESCSFITDDLFALLGRWPLDKDLKEVSKLAKKISKENFAGSENNQHKGSRVSIHMT